MKILVSLGLIFSLTACAGTPGANVASLPKTGCGGDLTEATLAKTETTWTYSVSVDIDAVPDVVWDLLTDSERFPTWNSTVTKIEGDIALGNEIKVYVPYAPGQAFPVTVTELVNLIRMVWTDAKGHRTFSLSALRPDLQSRFIMEEELSAEIAANLPDMRGMFSQYALDLKCASEGEK